MEAEDRKMDRFVWLEVHSVYSLMEGTIFLSRLVEIAKERGHRYLALTDTNGFYGLVNLINLCRDTGIQPLVGAKLEKEGFSAILFARNMKGYALISKALTLLHLQKDFSPVNFILEHRNSSDFIVITDNPGLISLKLKNLFAAVDVLKKDYAITYFTAKKIGVKPVLIYPVYFESKNDFHIHRLLRAIHLNKKISSLSDRDTRSRRAFFQSDGYILKNYNFMSDAIRNTVEIAKKCSFPFEMGNPVMPSYSKNSFKLLKSLCYKNLSKRYRRIDGEIIQRLEKELSVIKEKGFSDYFLTVRDIAKQSIYTCGRGSAASSLVSYLLFITHVDPVKHNLFFERFLNLYRTDPPDIDLDFPWDERDKILQYIFNKYGRDNTAMVSNHITFEARSSLREVAKVYGIPEQEIKEITKNIRHYYNRDSDDFIPHAQNKFPSRSIERILSDVVSIYGRPRFLSVHPGGVVITPRQISSYIPVQLSQKGVPVIQLEKDQAEDFGFVKIDILGNRSLAVIRDTLNLIEKHYKIKIDYRDFNPLNDRPTIETLAKGETIGVFYVESPAMRQLQKKTGTGDYEHLVIHSSIIRPAANIYIKEYIERLKGKPYDTPIPEMKEILKETYGIMCYQEDITKIAVKIAGFSLKEGQELRKVISKKNKKRRKLELREKFYRNLKERGVPGDKIDEIWNMIESFSGYSFCKAHSASYALVSFKSCYLKTHYPAEFMGSVLKNQGGYYSALAYISEARRMGLKIVMPDINTSRYYHYGIKDRIVIGFMLIKNLSASLATLIEIEREKRGPFKSLKDFIERTNPSPKDLLQLIKAGCFKSVEKYNTPQLLYIANAIASNISTNSTLREKGWYEGNLFQELEDSSQSEIKVPELPPYSREKSLSLEVETFGFILSEHPMSYYRKMIKENPIKASALANYTGKKILVAGIMVTAKTVLTKDRHLMQFVSFEDETDIFETVLFPDVYEKYALLLEEHRPYIIEGIVTSEFGVVTVEVKKIEKLNVSPEPQYALQDR